MRGDLSKVISCNCSRCGRLGALKHCGIEAFARGTWPDGKTMAAINVRCVEGIDLDALQVTKVDGKSR